MEVAQTYKTSCRYVTYSNLTYFQLISVCSPYKFVDILMIEIMKLVEKVKFITIKGFKGSLGARH